MIEPEKNLLRTAEPSPETASAARTASPPSATSSTATSSIPVCTVSNVSPSTGRPSSSSVSAEKSATGEPLPDNLYAKMRAAKNFQSAMMMVRQLEFSLFDFRIHREYAAGGAGLDCAGIYAILEQVREQVAVIRPPAWNRFARLIPGAA